MSHFWSPLNQNSTLCGKQLRTTTSFHCFSRFSLVANCPFTGTICVTLFPFLRETFRKIWQIKVITTPELFNIFQRMEQLGLGLDFGFFTHRCHFRCGKRNGLIFPNHIDTSLQCNKIFPILIATYIFIIVMGSCWLDFTLYRNFSTVRFSFNIPPGFMDCVCASKDVECDQLFFAQPHTLGHPHGHPQHHLLLHLHERQVENLHLQHPLII